MKISRFYQDQPFEIGDEVILSPANHRHAIQVLRLKTDENLILFNGTGGEFSSRLIIADKRKSQVIIESFDPVERESSLYSTIILAMIKPEKMDFAIQKLVELGVNEIQPMYTKRSVIKIKANRLDKKMQHWQGVVLGACEQSGRTAIPKVYQPQTITESLNIHANKHCFVMLPGNYPTISHVEKVKSDIALLIGPEGGFTTEEEQFLLEESVTPISFGKRILRAETAAISGLTASQLSWGDL